MNLLSQTTHDSTHGLSRSNAGILGAASTFSSSSPIVGGRTVRISANFPQTEPTTPDSFSRSRSLNRVLSCTHSARAYCGRPGIKPTTLVAPNSPTRSRAHTLATIFSEPLNLRWHPVWSLCFARISLEIGSRLFEREVKIGKVKEFELIWVDYDENGKPHPHVNRLSFVLPLINQCAQQWVKKCRVFWLQSEKKKNLAKNSTASDCVNVCVTLDLPIWLSSKLQFKVGNAIFTVYCAFPSMS